MAARATAAAPRSILVETSKGRVRVGNVPANAKVTFGPVQPGQRDFRSENVLRIYTSTNNQLAVITNVLSFRDESLTYQREVIETKSRSESERNAKGSRSESETEINTAWMED